MQKLRTTLLAAALAMLIPIDGCGGGGTADAGGAPTQQYPPLTMMSATGKITLPAGFKEPLTGMTVQSGVDSEPVAANGSFKIQVVGPGETPVYLLDSSDNIILMGYADGGASGSPEAGGNGQISALKTAESMMFSGLSGPLVPPPYWSNMLADILQTPQVSQLASTVAARVAANPTAISSGDTQLFTAARAACNAAVPGANQVVARERANLQEFPANQSFHVTVEAKSPIFESGNQNLILVQPSSVQGGIDILNSLEEPGTIQFENHFRRRAAAFIYQTATQVSGGDLTTIAPAVLSSPNPAPLVAQVSAGLSLSVVGSDLWEIAPANTLNKFPASLVDMLEGNGGFTPKKSEAIGLPLVPGTIRTDYTIVVVGPGNDNAFIPFEDPTPAGMQQEWTDTVNCLGYEEMILDILVPVIASRPFPGNPQWSSLSGVQLGEIAHLISAVPDMVTDFENGEFKNAFEIFLDEASPTIAEQILTAIWSQTLFSGNFQEQLEIAEHELKGFFSVINTVNFITTFIDASGVVVSSSLFNSYISWSAKVVTKGARLNPQAATVNADNPSVLLTAGPGGTNDPSAPYVYEYEVTGAGGGALENALGTSPKSTAMTTTNNQVQYLVGIHAEDGQKDTVTVTVFTNAGTPTNPVAGTEIGTADSVITVQLQEEGPCGLIPPSFSTGGPQISVSPTLIAPGQTVDISLTFPAGTTAQLNFGGNGNVLIHAVTASVSDPGDNATFPVNDPHAGGFLFSFTGSTSPQTVTMTVTGRQSHSRPVSIAELRDQYCRPRRSLGRRQRQEWNIRRADRGRRGRLGALATQTASSRPS